MKTNEEIKNMVNMKISLLKQLEESNKELIAELNVLCEQQDKISNMKSYIDNCPI